MKTIKINGRTFQYEILWDEDPQGFAGGESTSFYDGMTTISHKKYWFFGPLITEELPKLVFTLPISIEDDNYTKADIRERVEREVELLTRREEIAKGEII